MTPVDARRLLSARTPTLTEHRSRFGRIRDGVADELVPVLGEAGLTGRGGAGFPTARKVASITGRAPVVVGNGAEGEPLSRKDDVLIRRAPHLILDGLHLAADAVGSDEVYLYLPRHLVPVAHVALDERAAAGMDRRPVSVVEAPDVFVAGEESAVVRRIEGGRALPRDRTVPTSTSGVRGRPTLVNNVETLAHIALIARYGPRWFRSLGDPADPGTMLITLSGADSRRSVVELPTGTPFADVLARGSHDACDTQAVLVGGYHGSWIPLANLVEPTSRVRVWLTSAPAPARASFTYCRRLSVASPRPRTSWPISPIMEHASAGRAATGFPRLRNCSTTSPTARSPTACSTRCTGRSAWWTVAGRADTRTAPCGSPGALSPHSPPTSPNIG